MCPSSTLSTDTDPAASFWFVTDPAASSSVPTASNAIFEGDDLTVHDVPGQHASGGAGIVPTPRTVADDQAGLDIENALAGVRPAAGHDQPNVEVVGAALGVEVNVWRVSHPGPTELDPGNARRVDHPEQPVDDEPAGDVAADLW